jgi:predicted subunit of tRNA(5-methylaminomethyl-2-thiouridylate) methyltransferase
MIQSQKLEIALNDIVEWLAETEKRQNKQETPVLRTDKINALQMEQEVSYIYRLFEQFFTFIRT